MDTGRLRHPLKVESFQSAQDPDTGEMVQEWVEIASVWAAIEGVSGQEFFASGAEQSITTHKITIQYRDDITADMRLSSGNVQYEITAPLPNNKRTELVLMCKVLS